MNPYQEHAQCMQSLIQEMGDACPSVTWDGKPRSIIPGTAQRRSDLAPGGFQINADFQFDALVSSFGYSDASTLKTDMLRTPLDYLGDRYQAAAVHLLPGGLQVRVECNSLGQNA